MARLVPRGRHTSLGELLQRLRVGGGSTREFARIGEWRISSAFEDRLTSPFSLNTLSLTLLYLAMASFSEQLYNNATVLVKNFVAETQVRNHDLYNGLDLSQLNWLEQAWGQWYNYWGSPILATGILAFIMHEVRFSRRLSRLKRGVVNNRRFPAQIVYFGRCLPWMLIDYMGWFKKYKLQDVRSRSFRWLEDRSTRSFA